MHQFHNLKDTTDHTVKVVLLMEASLLYIGVIISQRWKNTSKPPCQAIHMKLEFFSLTPMYLFTLPLFLPLMGKLLPPKIASISGELY
jgi:hypothetical protein